MDAVTPKGHQTADTHSHVVRPQNMEWQKTRFPGCEAKTLLFDRSTGLMTALMRFAPGAVLPDHEHVNIEQTYVLEGRLVDKEGPAAGIEAKQGEFIWREAGSRHVAWCPEGGLMLAIFQVPNKFFEADGRVVDAAGQDWDETWGHTGKALERAAQRQAARRTSCARTAAGRRGGMVDASDLKSVGAKAPSRFESGRRHQLYFLESSPGFSPAASFSSAICWRSHRRCGIAGWPPVSCPAGTSVITPARAASCAPLPMVMCGAMPTRPPSITKSSMVTLPLMPLCATMMQ